MSPSFSLTNFDDKALLMKQLKELEDTNFIQPVSIETGPEKKIGYRRKLNVLHKGWFHKVPYRYQ